MGSDEKHTEAVKNAASEVDGHMALPCAKAFMLAEKLEIKLKDIRRICDENSIKIVMCQLGCFK